MKKKFIYFIFLIIFIALAIILVFHQNHINYIQASVQDEYQAWNSEVYNDWICHDKSIEIEEYMETKLGLDCYLVYSSNHVWNLIIINGRSYEFSATTLVFEKVSDSYQILDVRYGFYIDGEKMDYCYGVENWENLL